MAVNKYKGLHYENGTFQAVDDTLTVEQSLSISINGKPYTITMRTPGSEEALVRGLLFSEQIYSDQNHHPEIQITAKDELGFITAMNLIVKEDSLERKIEGARNIMSVSSCGICGKTELDVLPSFNGIKEELLLSAVKVGQMFDKMGAHQNTFRASGGSHAAAAFNMDAEMLSMEEDIGRHNAVDKVIGQLLLSHKLPEAKCLIVSGRISYEIVSKVYLAGIPYLAAVSAPSSLAVDYSKSLGITLMAFCRNHKLTAYSNVARLSA